MKKQAQEPSRRFLEHRKITAQSNLEVIHHSPRGNIKSEEDRQQKIRNATYSNFKEELGKWNNRIYEHTKQKRSKKDPNAQYPE